MAYATGYLVLSMTSSDLIKSVCHLQGTKACLGWDREAQGGTHACTAVVDLWLQLLQRTLHLSQKLPRDPSGAVSRQGSLGEGSLDPALDIRAQVATLVKSYRASLQELMTQLLVHWKVMLDTESNKVDSTETWKVFFSCVKQNTSISPGCLDLCAFQQQTCVALAATKQDSTKVTKGNLAKHNWDQMAFSYSTTEGLCILCETLVWQDLSFPRIFVMIVMMSVMIHMLMLLGLGVTTLDMEIAAAGSGS